jgi:hypothetical protein
MSVTLSVLVAIAVIIGIGLIIHSRKSVSQPDDKIKDLDNQLTNNKIDLRVEELERERIKNEKDSKESDTDFFNKR